MKKIEAIIRSEKLEALRLKLESVGYPGITVSEVKGHGKQRGVSHQFRGQEYNVYFLPKTRVEVVVPDGDAKKITDAIVEACRSGTVGDGKIFVTSISESIRIRSGETGDQAII